jgi:tyrosinase
MPWFPQDIDLSAMNDHGFTSAPGGLGFGGGVTVFAQFGGRTGALESNPHNSVHVMIGGPSGFMSDPLLAGLDPIFWLHHCNIDRLWAAWLTRPENVQESSQAWLKGPSPRRFEMPDPSGNVFVFTPEQVLPGGPLEPAYDNLQSGTGGGAMIAALDGPAGERGAMPAQMSSGPPRAASLVGTNQTAVTIDRASITTTVRLQPQVAAIAGDPVEQRVILNLENVRGTRPSGVLSISLAAPAQTTPASTPHLVTSVALFGLARASAADNEHGGSGISVAVDIAGIARELAQQSGGALDQIEVHLDQPPHDKQEPITVERVSIYKQPIE